MKPTFYNRIGKRCLDVAIALAGLLILSPLLLIVAVAVRLTSPGPAFFSQMRVGRLERPFRIFKFRTMLPAQPASGSLLTAAGDPRVTPLGRWLRKTKFDELPQLYNVLVGDMSLVGPRPEVPIYTQKYSPRHKRVLQVRPGVTAPHINFDEEALLAGREDKETFYLTSILPAKLECDLAYCENIRFSEDLRIVFSTVGGVVHRIVGYGTDYVDRAKTSCP